MSPAPAPKKKPSFWEALPPKHKKRLFQGIAAYCLMVVAAAAWVGLHAGETVKDWENRTPRITASLHGEGGSDAALVEEISHPTTEEIAAPSETTATETAPPAGVETAPAETPPAAAAPVRRQQARIAIIMSDVGLSVPMTDRAINDLPSQMALAFSPYSQNLENWLKKAEIGQHETILLIPMEPAAYPKDDPGPKALLTRLSEDDNMKNLEWILARPGKGKVIGTMNFMGSRFLSDNKNLMPVFAELQSKKVFFVENAAPAAAQSKDAAAPTYIPYIATDVNIDISAADGDIRQQLLALEKIALDRGYAVGVAHPYPVTLNTLISWSESLSSRGIKLVPVTTILRDMAAHEDTTGQPSPL